MIAIKAPHTVLITGSAIRIGAIMAEHLAQRGFNIALHYNQSRQEADTLCHKILSRYPVACKIFQADFSDIHASLDMFDKVVEYFKHVDVLINNASNFLPSTFLNTNPYGFTANLTVHLATPLFLMQRFVLQTPQNSLGVVINISDAMLLQGQYQKYFDYEATKSSLDQLSLIIQQILPKNITIHTIKPGKLMSVHHKTNTTSKTLVYQSITDFLTQVEACLNHLQMPT